MRAVRSRQSSHRQLPLTALPGKLQLKNVNALAFLFKECQAGW